MFVVWFIRLAQIFLDFFYRPPKCNKVTCYSVLYYHKGKHYGTNSTSRYLRKFSCVRDVEWLSSKDVHLFCVSESEFVFVRCTSGVDIHNISDHPFLYAAKSDHVEEFGIIPTDLALDLMRERKDDGSNIGCLHNLGRCGSTLVSNMVHKTGQCQVLSEPGALLDIALLAFQSPKLLNDPQTVAILRAALLFLAKSPDARYFIKIHTFAMKILPLIHRALPRACEAFMCREFRPMLLSFKKAFTMNLSYRMFKFIFTPIGFITKESVRAMESQGVDNLDKMFFYFFCKQTRTFIDECVSRADLISYSYETLLADPAAFTSHFLDHIGVGSQFTELALTAMKEDSQKNSWLSKKEVDKRSQATVTILEEDVEFARDLAERHFGIELEEKNLGIVGLPNLWNEKK